MICPTDKISLLKSIIDLQPEFKKIYDFIDRDSSLTDSLDLKSSIKKYKMQNLSFVNQKIDPVFMNDLKRRNRYSLKKCDIETQGEIIDCTKAEQYVVYNFNGFCLLHDLAKLNLNQSSLDNVKNLLNYGEENKFKININMNPITRFDDNLFYFYLLNHNNMVRSFENPDIVDGMFTYFHRLDVKIYQYKRKNYEVNQMTTKYSASLNNRKCLNEENYNRVAYPSKVFFLFFYYPST